MFASCGQERDVVLWQGNTMRKVCGWGGGGGRLGGRGGGVG